MVSRASFNAVARRASRHPYAASSAIIAGVTAIGFATDPYLHSPNLDMLGDARRLRQMVINLVTNAVKFTPPGGRITVTLERDEEQVLLRVTDTGAGIPRGFLPHVFEPFAQADDRNPQGGLGLGLSIVRHLVNVHAGTITAASEGEGHGATFTVRLPVLSEAAVPVSSGR